MSESQLSKIWNYLINLVFGRTDTNKMAIITEEYRKTRLDDLVLRNIVKMSSSEKFSTWIAQEQVRKQWAWTLKKTAFYSKKISFIRFMKDIHIVLSKFSEASNMEVFQE